MGWEKVRPSLERTRAKISALMLDALFSVFGQSAESYVQAKADVAKRERISRMVGFGHGSTSHAVWGETAEILEVAIGIGKELTRPLLSILRGRLGQLHV